MNYKPEIITSDVHFSPSKFSFSVTELGIRGSPINFYNIRVLRPTRELRERWPPRKLSTPRS